MAWTDLSILFFLPIDTEITKSPLFNKHQYLDYDPNAPYHENPGWYHEPREWEEGYPDCPGKCIRIEFPFEMKDGTPVTGVHRSCGGKKWDKYEDGCHYIDTGSEHKGERLCVCSTDLCNGKCVGPNNYGIDINYPGWVMKFEKRATIRGTRFGYFWESTQCALTEKYHWWILKIGVAQRLTLEWPLSSEYLCTMH